MNSLHNQGSCDSDDDADTGNRRVGGTNQTRHVTADGCNSKPRDQDKQDRNDDQAQRVVCNGGVF